MPETLLYYITSRAAFHGDEPARRRRLVEKITEAATHGVDYIQLREKDLSTRELESLAREATNVLHNLRIRNSELKTALLINSRTDIALATAAAGVHLPANDVSPEAVRTTWRFSSSRGRLTRELQQQAPLISVSCHSPNEVAKAASNQATFAVFAPVFEKPGTPSQGLQALRQACQAEIPVLALGGVTLQNVESCLRAGAAGIAAIRLFQENDIATTVRKLRS